MRLAPGGDGLAVGENGRVGERPRPRRFRPPRARSRPPGAAPRRSECPGAGRPRRRGGAGAGTDAGASSRARTRIAVSRRRTARPSSMARVWVATASIGARSWETSITVPSNASRADSSASRLSVSRWFVGSSSTSRLPPRAISATSSRRRRSPPDSRSTGASAASPENRKPPSSVRAWVWVRSPAARTVSRTLRPSRSPAPCCE